MSNKFHSTTQIKFCNMADNTNARQSITPVSPSSKLQLMGSSMMSSHKSTFFNSLPIETQVQQALTKFDRTERDNLIIYEYMRDLPFWRQFFDSHEDIEERDSIIFMMKQAKIATYDPGAVVYHEGDISNDCIYLVLSGELSVIVKERDQLSQDKLRVALKKSSDSTITGSTSPTNLHTRNISIGSQISPFTYPINEEEIGSPQNYDKGLNSPIGFNPGIGTFSQAISISKVSPASTPSLTPAKKMVKNFSFIQKKDQELDETVRKLGQEYGYAVDILESKGYFGQKILENENIRTETILARKRSQLIVLKKQFFKAIKADYSKRKKLVLEFMEEFFPKMEIIVSKKLHDSLYHSLDQQFFTLGQVIAVEGQSTNNVYIIYEGRCEVFKTVILKSESSQMKMEKFENLLSMKNLKREEIKIHSLVRGAFLCEEILFSPECKIDFSIRVESSTCKLLVLSKKRFLTRFPKEMQSALKVLYENKVRENLASLKNALNSKGYPYDDSQLIKAGPIPVTMKSTPRDLYKIVKKSLSNITNSTTSAIPESISKGEVAPQKGALESRGSITNEGQNNNRQSLGRLQHGRSKTTVEIQGIDLDTLMEKMEEQDDTAEQSNFDQSPLLHLPTRKLLRPRTQIVQSPNSIQEVDLISQWTPKKSPGSGLFDTRESYRTEEKMDGMRLGGAVNNYDHYMQVMRQKFGFVEQVLTGNKDLTNIENFKLKIVDHEPDEQKKIERERKGRLLPFKSMLDSQPLSPHVENGMTPPQLSSCIIKKYRKAIKRSKDKFPASLSIHFDDSPDRSSNGTPLLRPETTGSQQSTLITFPWSKYGFLYKGRVSSPECRKSPSLSKYSRIQVEIDKEITQQHKNIYEQVGYSGPIKQKNSLLKSYGSLPQRVGGFATKPRCLIMKKPKKGSQQILDDFLLIQV